MACIDEVKITKIEESLQAVLQGITKANGRMTDVIAVDIEEIRHDFGYELHEMPRLIILDDIDQITFNQSYVNGQIMFHIQGIMHPDTGSQADRAYPMYKRKNALVNDIKVALFEDVTWGGIITHPSHGIKVTSDLGMNDPIRTFVLTVIANYHTIKSLF